MRSSPRSGRRTSSAPIRNKAKSSPLHKVELRIEKIQEKQTGSYPPSLAYPHCAPLRLELLAKQQLPFLILEFAVNFYCLTFSLLNHSSAHLNFQILASIGFLKPAFAFSFDIAYKDDVRLWKKSIQPKKACDDLP